LVLSRLEPSNLNAVLRYNDNTILNLLVEAAKNENAEHLAWMIE
jgi:hypothetical protein